MSQITTGDDKSPAAVTTYSSICAASLWFALCLGVCVSVCGVCLVGAGWLVGWLRYPIYQVMFWPLGQ